MSEICQRAVSPNSELSSEATSSRHRRHKHTGARSTRTDTGTTPPPIPAPVYTCARRLAEVRTAWSIVYERYVEKKLIHNNQFGIHTVPQAVGRNACVIHQTNGEVSGSTLTLMGDSSKGLPLDSVYARELDALRWKDRGLVEVGLLAESCRGARRGARALFDLMRWAVYYTLHIVSTDIIIGVHPHHMRFYTRCFGLKPFAQPTEYPLVNDNPVVPLRLPLREALGATVLPRGLAYIRDNPVAPSVFRQRFRFEPEQLRGSMIERFLGNHHGATTRSEQAPDASASQANLLRTLPDAVHAA